MAGIIDHVRSVRYAHDQHIIFVHTGGTPALFAGSDDLATMLTPAEKPRTDQ